MAGLFFSRKSKNDESTSGEPQSVVPEAQTVYEPLAQPPSLLDDPPDAIAGIPDLYGVLGVDPRSSDDIIRYAYRKKAAKLLDARWRPGRAARQLAELNAAYEILGKPDRRADYDHQRARMHYYQQAARQDMLTADDGIPARSTRNRSPRTDSPWRAPRAPRGLLEVIAIIGVVAMALYAGYTVLGNGDLINLGAIQDAGAAMGLPVRPRTTASATVVPVLAAVTPTPRQVIVPQVSVPSPTPVLAPTATTAPEKPSGPVRTTVRVSNPSPPRRSDLSITMRLTRDNRPVAGAPVYLIAHYRTVDERFPVNDGTTPTNDQGEATITFNIGDATAGHAVNVDVIAQVEGETVQAQTTFLPR
ncbi:MAG: DnaJ domain-containing protein [Chloroflexota bacterium]